MNVHHHIRHLRATLGGGGTGEDDGRVSRNLLRVGLHRGSIGGRDGDRLGKQHGVVGFQHFLHCLRGIGDDQQPIGAGLTRRADIFRPVESHTGVQGARKYVLAQQNIVANHGILR